MPTPGPFGSNRSPSGAEHAKPVAYGRSEVAMLPMHPVSNEEFVEVVRITISAEITKLKDELRADLLSELSLRVECQFDKQASVVSQRSSSACQAKSEQRTRLSIDTVGSDAGLQTAELALSQPRETAETSRRIARFDPAQLTEVKSETLAKDLDDASGQFAFSGSIWDAALIIGVHPMGNVAALQLALIFFVNISVQVLHIFLVHENLTSTDFDDNLIRGFRDFRTRVAHSSKWQDVVTGKSLAIRLCTSDGSLNMASFQSSVLGDINHYLPQRGTIFGEGTGQMMCTLALIVWCLVATKEIRTICMTFLAVLKRSFEGEETRNTEIKLHGEQWVFSSFSRRRLLVITVVLLIRLLLACFLLRAGMKWLIYTINIENLILNAVALECILQLDELLFEAVAPQRVVALCQQLEPLPLPKLDCCGIDLPTVFGLMFVNGLVFCVGFLDMSENVDQLKKARAELCDGELNFVYQDAPTVPFFHWAFTGTVIRDFVAEDLVQRIIRHDFGYQMIKETQYPESRGTSGSLQASANWNIEQWTSSSNPLCKDSFHKYDRSFYSYESYQKSLNIRFAAEAPVTSCVDLKAHCDADTVQGTTARSVCPVTCGCDNPLSHLVLGTTWNGCPAYCTRSLDYEKARNTTPCVDTTWAVLSTMPAWLYFASHFAAIANGENNTGPGWRLGAFLVSNATKFGMLGKLHVAGCPILLFLFNTYGIELCSEENSIFRVRSLQLFCPQTCKCTRDMANCPRSCPTSSVP